MLNRTEFVIGRSDGVLDESTKAQLKKFETARGLPLSGFDGKQEIATVTFKQLATEYMDVICSDDDSKPFSVTREDFLARGKGKDGKGDIQGCGEFNSILLFSKADKAELEKPENHQDRNSKNTTNRRVMILLFKPGSEIDPAKWPCPTVKEGVAGCKARFFSDGERRRQNTDEEREFVKTKDTFACRFYQRLTDRSPCERVIALAPFRYAVQMAEELPWTINASIRFTSEDGTHRVDLSPKAAVVTDTAHTFTFGNFRLGVRYRAELIEDKLTLGLFGFVDISAIQHPKNSVNHVPLAPPKESSPPDGRGGTEIPVPIPSAEPTRNVPASALTKDI